MQFRGPQLANCGLKYMSGRQGKGPQPISGRWLNLFYVLIGNQPGFSFETNCCLLGNENAHLTVVETN